MSEKSNRTAVKSPEHATHAGGKKQGLLSRMVQSYLNSAYNNYFMPHM